MAYSGKKGISRIVRAFAFSWQGIKACYQNEEAFRQETWLALVAIPLAIWLADTPMQMALMISAVILLLIVEIFNSAIEAAIDRFGEERHILSGRAKDMGSAAVLFAVINLLVIWGLVLWQIYG